MKDITIRCVKCGDSFKEPYASMERWSFRCPKCREGVKPKAPEIGTGEEEEEC